jgi:hypothetical protein
MGTRKHKNMHGQFAAGIQALHSWVFPNTRLEQCPIIQIRQEQWDILLKKSIALNRFSCNYKCSHTWKTLQGDEFPDLFTNCFFNYLHKVHRTNSKEFWGLQRHNIMKYVINQIQHRLLAFPSQNAAGFKGGVRANLKPCMSLNYINRLGIPLELYCSVLCSEIWAYQQSWKKLANDISVRLFFGWENSTITVQNGSYETSSQMNFGMAWHQMYLGRFFSVVHLKLR